MPESSLCFASGPTLSRTDRLTHILQTITADEMRNQLLYI